MGKRGEYPDLDALVLAEIESIKGRHQHNPVSPEHEVCSQEQIQGAGETPSRASEVTPIRGEEQHYRDFTGEEAELLDHYTEPECEDLNEQTPPRLFTPEEEAFMHRAIGFLSGRDNADVILGRIWEQITENHPERFFDPEALNTEPLSGEQSSAGFEAQAHSRSNDPVGKDL